MAKHPDEDLFADTTMTFGEHLDELRVSLGKAVLGLLVGFIVGLFIANRIALAHGGTIELESEPGQGTRFVVGLPRRRTTEQVQDS